MIEDRRCRAAARRKKVKVKRYLFWRSITSPEASLVMPERVQMEAQIYEAKQLAHTTWLPLVG